MMPIGYPQEVFIETATNTTVMPLIPLIAGVFGLLIGSFLNVVIYRVPAGKSLLPSSRCPRCDAAIRPWQNIPVLSWLLLRGKCARCHTRIPIRYPLVELGTAVFFSVVTLWWLSTATAETLSAVATQLAAYLFLAAVSVALALIDIDTFRLPNAIVVPSFAVLALLFTSSAALGEPWSQLGRALVGAALLTVFYGLLWFFWPGGMGFGDVKLAAVLGLALGWLGWGSFVVGAFAAFVCGGVFGVVLMALGKAGRKSRVPFGPWMLLGCWVGIFAGEELASWYVAAFLSA